MEEITAIYLGEQMSFSNDNDDASDRVIIGNARLVNGSAKGASHPDFKVKGPAEIDELTARLTYRFYGKWSDYRNKRTKKTEKQFHFSTFVANQPHDHAGVVVYLSRLNGVGDVTANQLWRAFRSDAVRILREEPEVAAAATRLTIERALSASEQLKELAHLEDCYISLASLLDRRGFRKTLPRDLIHRWGNRAAEIIQRDPLTMTVYGFPSCSFARCDKMYGDLGLPLGRMKRQALCAWNAISRRSEGDTWHPFSVAERAIHAGIGGAEPNATKAIRLAKRAKLLACHVDDSVETWLADDRHARSEMLVAKCIADSLRDLSSWPDVSDVRGISDHQRAGLIAATKTPISLFLGGPGTGKTWTIARFVKFLQDRYGPEEIAVASPTNKAAARAKEVMAEIDVRCEVTTTYRLLRMVPGLPPKHNADNPFPYKVIILDEVGMISTDHMALLLAARSRGTLLMMVGDTNQSPPIQHGKPVHDFILSGVVGTGMLTEPQRNAGAIVAACNAIAKGESWSDCQRIDLSVTPPENLKIIPAKNEYAQIDRLLKVVRQAKSQGFDPIADAQVITATNNMRRKINAILQRELNPQAKAIEGNPFRVGDKVSCTDNGQFRTHLGEVGQVETINKREIGRVVDVEVGQVVVRFDSPDRVVVFPKGKSGQVSETSDSGDGRDGRDGGDGSDDNGDDKTGCKLRLAYAETCHAMQGSECRWSIPIIESGRGAAMVTSREWFLTALSRGKEIATPIGDLSTINRMCRKSAIEKRKTFLADLIKQEVRKI